MVVTCVHHKKQAKGNREHQQARRRKVNEVNSTQRVYISQWSETYSVLYSLSVYEMNESNVRCFLRGAG